MNLRLAGRRLREIATKRKAIEDRLSDAIAEAQRVHRDLTRERAALLRDLAAEDAALRELICELRAEAGDSFDDEQPGVSFRAGVSVESVDIETVCRAVASGEISAEFVQFDERAYLNKAKRLGGLFSIPGVEHRKTWSVAVSATDEQREGAEE